MVDSIAVSLPNSITTVYTDALLIIAGKFFKRVQQHTVFISEAQICILDLISRDERIPITDGLIMLVDLGTDYYPDGGQCGRPQRSCLYSFLDRIEL